MPIDSSVIHAGQIIFDAVYAPHETKLIKAAKTQGAQVVHGSEMLLWQAGAQFKLYTGQNPPEAAMRRALMKGLKA
jgi:shikimate dehydrogenase